MTAKNFYTNAGELSDEWTEFEFTSYATPSYFYTYFYNYVANTTVYITDVEILGYMSAYSESQLTILKDSIESEVKRATAQRRNVIFFYQAKCREHHFKK